MKNPSSGQGEGKPGFKPTQPGFHLGYRPALDGLRGFAVLAVLFAHLKMPWLKNGDLGVDIFFALSGFLITVMLSEEWRRTGSIRLGQFYMRRVLRLYPALLFMLFLVSFISPARDYIFSSLTYTTNWVIALKIRPLNLEMGHTWTLAIEEQYYLLWPPFLLFLLRRLPPRRVILFPLGLAGLSLLLRVASWSTSHEFWRYNAGADMHADGLLLGSAFGLATALNLLPGDRKFILVLRVATLLAVAGLWYSTQIASLPTSFYVWAGLTWVAIATLLVISQLAVYPVKILQRIFEFTPLVWLGRISYGLYLWQVPVLVLLNFQALGMSFTQSQILKIVLICLITVLSYRYIEKPIQRLKNRFTDVSSPLQKL
jgi:peptidoglycan/LPS O-acetylase OafA/YrhL